MDIYTTSFIFPRHPSATYSSPNLPTSQTFLRSQTQPVAVSDHESIQKVVAKAMHDHGCLITFSPADHGHGWHFYLSGSYPQVMGARGQILRECPNQTRAAIKVLRSDILESSASASPSLKPDVRRRLDEIASQTQCQIVVVNQNSTLPPAPDTLQSNNGLETERVCELVATGDVDAVDIARVRLLVFLDELGGLHAEACEIDQKLHAIIAARRRSVIQTIQEETATNIYFLSALHGTRNPAITNSIAPLPAAPQAPGNAPRSNANIIWITGEFFGVQRARDMIYSMSLHKSKITISRDTAILPRKLDWMLTERTEDLKSIMSDNGTYISFPAMGSHVSMITVYGDNRTNIQRTIRSVMAMACQFYVASFWLLPIHFNVLMPGSTVNPAQVAGVLKGIANASGAEVVFKGNCFEMHGLEHEVRGAVAMVLELDLVKNFQHEIRFSIELANEHREFISGKKNGKINKIMQTAGVKIKFETVNEHNFLIDIAGNDAGAMHGLGMLQEELPAEISFHVPEGYHKRIIGVGGRSIQRIMKKYGVYVKFSNAEEFAALGGYQDNDDNVVARTPAKNAMNLENLKAAVMELVNPKDKDYMVETVSIPRRYHRTLLGEKSIFIHDIELKTNSHVRFPDSETASDIVSIFGPESQVHIAVAMLLDHVPFEAEMAIPPHAELPRICSSPEFLSFVERLKHDYQITVIPNVKADESSFKFRCQRSNSDFISSAREMLESFLLGYNINVYPPTNHRRSDSFADAFPHFNSKLLSGAAGTDATDLPRGNEGFAERRIRLASSTPDVKALFNSPAYVYNLPEQDEQDDVSFPSRSSYGPSQTSSDYWSTPPLTRSTLPAVSNSRSTEDAFKRGSDSLLEAKIRSNLSKPRSLQNRAQSLDLTFSLSRITETASHVPASPTNSTTGTSSPTSATAPSFPSVYGPPSKPRPSRLDPNAADEISRAISNIKLS